MDHFGFSHKSGILMALSALPSPYGIGTMGAPCYQWIDAMAQMRQTVWQVLPLNPTAYGDSPYQSPAVMAGNPYFLDLDDLHRRGLLTRAELATAKTRVKAIDYGDLFAHRIDLLRQAYRRYKPTGSYYQFRFANRDWLLDYAHFMALKVKNNYVCWREWADEERNYVTAKQQRGAHLEEIGFWCWVQYTFHCQWQAVKVYAHKKGIRIFGDMPIYVAYDSADVWSDPSNYQLDGNLDPVEVAGCPPDGFSPDGQLWGNPLYDWDKMEADGYQWWIRRFERNLKLYDIVRVDHFRGFAGYYAIPFGDKNARRGVWKVGPGGALFDAVSAALPNAKIVAEDLGHITPDVRKLLSYTDLPGMKVLQFAFFDQDSEYLPRCYKTDNCVVYTGSHDSDCTASWCHALKGEVLTLWKKECPRTKGSTRTRDMIRLALASRANLAVIPWQDWLELSNEQGRMNTPSVAQGNWVWRAARMPSDKIKKEVAKATRKAHRQA